MRWDKKTVDSQAVEALSVGIDSNHRLRLKDQNLATTLARLLVMRGITDGRSG